jgi:hypothetical protein
MPDAFKFHNHAATRISSQEEMHGWGIIFRWLGGTDDSESLAETRPGRRQLIFIVLTSFVYPNSDFEMKVPAKIDPGGIIYSSTGTDSTVTIHQLRCTEI